MATSISKPTQPTPATGQTAAATMKVTDAIYSFRPTRRFRPDDSKTCVTSLDFDDSGELALVARDDETLQIYNCKEGKHAKELKSQKYGVHLARFTHHAQSIIYASTKVDDTIRYLSSHDNSYIRYFRGHTAPVTSLALSPASDHFLSCSQDNTVRLWALNSPSVQGQLNLQAPYLCAYDPSASVFAVASPPVQSILLYDLRQYERPPFATFDLRPIESRFAGRAGNTSNTSSNKNNPNSWTSIHFSNDGKVILLGTAGAGHYVLDAFDGSLKFFLSKPSNPSSSTSTSTATSAPSAPSPSPADRRIAPGEFPLSSASASGAGSASNTSALSQQLFNGNNGSNGNDGLPRVRTQGDVCLSPDGRYALGGGGGSGGGGGAAQQEGILVWDLHAPVTGERVLRPAEVLPGPGRAAVVGYNPRHNMLASADGDLVLWLPDAEALG